MLGLGVRLNVTDPLDSHCEQTLTPPILPTMVKFDEKEARKTDLAYLTPDVTRQRMRTLEALQLKVGEFVLDVGCGTGLLAHDMATLVGEDGRVVGIDNNQHRLMLAEQRCADLPQVHMKQSQVENLHEAAESMDAVSCVRPRKELRVPGLI